MKITRKDNGDVAILELNGNLRGGPAAVELMETMTALAEEGKKKILIDMGKVKLINSSGIGALVSGFTSVKNRDGTVKLLNVTEKIESLLMITQLITVFQCFDDEDDAIKSFEEN